MSRVKRGFKARRRRKRLFVAAQGSRGSRKSLYRNAKNSVFKAWCYAYRDRRNKKRLFRRLWIARINAASRIHGVKYSHFVHQLNQSNVKLDRKVIADIAVHDSEGFGRLVEFVSSNS